MASPKVTHQMLIGKLYAQLFNQLAGKKCQPFVSPFDITVWVDKKRNVVQPDLGIICDMETGRDEKDRYMGIPSLVVEVMSASSVTNDMIRKLQTYMLSGVKEYWIINPVEETALIYRFKDYEVAFHKVAMRAEGITSYGFPDIKVTW